MPDEADDNTHANAAGPWQEGEPERRGRYLIEYEQYDQRRIFVADYCLEKTANDLKLKWASMSEGARVLRYACIDSPHAQYPE